MAKRRLKKKFRIIIVLLLILIFSFGLIYSLINIFNWKIDVDKNNNIIKELRNNIKINKEDKEYKVDFKSLKEQNSDTVCYLKVSGTKIDYVVVKGEDNSFYLNHNFNKEYNSAGWIFMDYHNNLVDDRNIVIYGHNMRDGSMFGSLDSTLKKEWQEDKNNQKIMLVKEDGTYYYQVFSTYTIEPEEYYIKTDFSSNDNFYSFIKELKSRSNYDYNVEVNENDKILTLSSCTNSGKNRVVLHAKLIIE